MKKIIKDTLILTAITLISGLALATVYQITKQPIAQAEAAAELAAYEGVFPEATFETLAPASFDPVAAGVADGEGVTVEAVAAARRDGQTVGYALKVTSPNGYGGNITVAVGVATDAGDGTRTGFGAELPTRQSRSTRQRPVPPAPPRRRRWSPPERAGPPAAAADLPGSA